MSEPEKIIAGNAVAWETVITPENDLSAHAFNYRFVGPVSFDESAVYLLDTVSVSLTSGDTAAYTPGEYQWFLFATLGAERELVCRGRMVIEPDPSGIDNADNTSHAEKMLAAIDARLEGRIVTDHQRYMIGNRSLDRIPIIELKQLRNQYAWQARDAKVARGVLTPHRKVRYI